MTERSAGSRAWLIIGAVAALPWAGSQAGEYLENWDSIGQGGDGMHAFTFMPLVPDPDAAAADGSRCAEDDPDGFPGGRPPSFCRPWTGSDWHVHLPENAPVPKAFSGDGALHMGVHRNNEPSFDGYTTAQLSAAVSPPLTLRPTGGPHMSGGRRPELTLRHIVSLADDTCFFIPDEGTTADRAVVQVALADPETGEIVSDWRNLRASENGPVRLGTRVFINCKFDPVDDGSTEDDLRPDRPASAGGGHNLATPADTSSTCYPVRTFSRMGDYDSTDISHVGDAAEGSGERGSTGTGVWVRSRFDLSAYSGRTVRIRFLASTLEISGPTGIAWPDIFFVLGVDLRCVRGWLIDDIRVTGVTRVLTPATPGNALTEATTLP